MARHSKNNTAGSVFTYHERQLMGSGTQKMRLNACSIKPFDACCVCLSTAVDPVVCRGGHLFCKECIYLQLVQQKKEKKAHQEKYQQQQAKLERQKEEEEAKTIDEMKRKFEKTNEGLLPTATHSTPQSTESSLKCFAAITNEKGEVIYADEKQRKALEKKGLKVRQLHESSDAFTHAKAFASYWVPQLAPSAQDEAVLSPPDKRTVCPEGGHHLALKQLVPVKFEKDSSKDEKFLYCCPTCLRHLTNAVKCVVLGACGHVICRKCQKTFANDEGKCPVCSVLIRKKDLIQLQSGGTGFAAHDERLEASKDAPSARV